MIRPLSDREKKGVLRRLTGGWENIFDDAVDVFNRSEFVSSEVERSPLATAVRSLTRFNCRRWARADKSQFSEGVNGANSNICSAYLDTLGENPDSGSLAPPFVGGQNPAAQYTVVITGITHPSGSSLPSAWVRYPNRLQGKIVEFRLNNTPPSGFWTISMVNDSGVARSLDYLDSTNMWRQNLGSNGPPNLGNIELTAIGAGESTTNITSVYFPPSIPPSLPVLPPTVEVNIPGLGPIDLTVELDSQGRPVICIPELNICATVDVPGIGPAVPGVGEPGYIGEPGETLETGDGGDDSGAAGDGQVLGGLKIGVIAAPANAKQFSPGIYRAACYVYMGTEEGLDHDPAGAMLKSGQFVFPELPNLTHWAVKANPEYNLEVTPYYIEVTE